MGIQFITHTQTHVEANIILACSNWLRLWDNWVRCSAMGLTTYPQTMTIALENRRRKWNV